MSSILRKPEITDAQRHLTCQRIVRNIVDGVISMPDGELEDHEGRLMAAVSRRTTTSVEQASLETELFATRQVLVLRTKMMDKRAEIQREAGLEGSA